MAASQNNMYATTLSRLEKELEEELEDMRNRAHQEIFALNTMHGPEVGNVRASMREEELLLNMSYLKARCDVLEAERNDLTLTADLVGTIVDAVEKENDNKQKVVELEQKIVELQLDNEVLETVGRTVCARANETHDRLVEKMAENVVLFQRLIATEREIVHYIGVNKMQEQAILMLERSANLQNNSVENANNNEDPRYLEEATRTVSIENEEGNPLQLEIVELRGTLDDALRDFEASETEKQKLQAQLAVQGEKLKQMEQEETRQNDIIIEFGLRRIEHMVKEGDMQREIKILTAALASQSEESGGMGRSPAGEKAAGTGGNEEIPAEETTKENGNKRVLLPQEDMSDQTRSKRRRLSHADEF